MPSLVRRTLFLVCAAPAALLAASCETEEPTSTRAPSPPPSEHGAERSLGPIMDAARLAFYQRSDDQAFESGTTSWYARVDGADAHVVARGSRRGELPEGGIDLRTVSIAREAWAWSDDDAPYAPAEGGALRRGDGDVVEWLRGSDAGVEQSWTFSREPDGDGPLVVRVRIDGTSGATLDADGIHLKTDGGGVRYGHGTWIDASGDEVSVPAEWAGGVVTLTVPEDVVESSAFPAVLDPIVGPERETDPGVFGPDASTVATGPYVACTGATCLAMYNNAAGAQRLRIGPDGAYLDDVPTFTSPLRVRAVTPVEDGFAAVFCNAESPSFSAVQLRRFDATGAEVGSPTTLTSSGRAPTISCVDDVCLALWSGGSQVVGRRVDADGTILDSLDLVLGAGSSDNPSIAASDSTFLIAYSGSARRVTTAGTILDSPPLSTGFGSAPALASDGSSWLAALGNRLRSIAADGSLGTSRTSTSSFISSIAWTGDRYVASGSSSGLAFRAYDASGLEMGAAVTLPGYNDGMAAGIPTGGAFVGGRFASVDAKLQRLDVAGTAVGSDFYLNVGSNPETAPLVLAGDGEYLLLWTDRRLGTYGLYGQRIGLDGEAIAAPFLVQLVYVRRVAGIFGGGVYTITAHDGGSARIQRLTPAGVPLDGGGLALGFSATSTSVSWDGASFLVAGASPDNSFGSVRVARIGPSAGVIDPGGIAVYTGALVEGIASAYDGTEHIVVYRRASNAVHYGSVAPGGSVFGSGISLGTAAVHPRVACGASRCLVTDGGAFRAALPSGSVTVTSTLSVTGSPGIAHADGVFVVAAAEAGNEQVSGARFRAGPIAQIGPWFDMSVTPSTTIGSPTVAAIGNEAVVAYSRIVDAENARRVFHRHITLELEGGDACSVGSDCATGFCVDGVCCNSACGNGANDCQVCSASLGATADGVCTPRPSGVECRAINGVCDVAETCDGVSGACPANVRLGDETVCREAGGECDIEERCSGSSNDCPADARADGTVCREAVGGCDAPETCDGGLDCPADAIRPADFVCRAAAGDCDVEEQCDGVSDECPGDELLQARTTCREATASCDIAEECDGESAQCPENVKKAQGTVCREAVNECDVEEVCSGTSGFCPSDRAVEPGTPCGDELDDACDVQDTCAGTTSENARCEAKVADAGTPCRPDAGACDVEEFCDGASPSCPVDAGEPVGVPCGAPTPCREAGACGADLQCASAPLPDGTPCDGGVCTAGECGPAPSTASTGTGAGGDLGDGGNDGGDGDGDAATSGGSDEAADEGGCGCRSAGSPSTDGPLTGLVALGLVGLLRRRVRAEARTSAPS